MIRFTLRCNAEHEFEGWFRSNDDFDTQKKRGFVDCPSCGSHKVEKALMAPNIGRSHKNVPALSPAQMRAMLVELRRQVETKCDYVGERFAEEARRIHYGESDPRGIYGEASADDAKDLAEEGIEVKRIPWLPRTDA